MKPTRLASLILTAAIAASLISAATASASAPEFHPGTLDISVGEGSTTALETESTGPVNCTRVSSTGEITGAKTVGSVVVTFTGCSTNEGGGCDIKSVGAPTEGLIRTDILRGELGSVKTAEAASGVGLLISPATGTEFVAFEGSCIEESPAVAVGTIAGELTPIRTLSKDGKVILEGSKGAQKIKEINVLGTVEEPKFEAGGIRTSETSSELQLNTNAVEVT